MFLTFLSLIGMTNLVLGLSPGSRSDDLSRSPRILVVDDYPGLITVTTQAVEILIDNAVIHTAANYEEAISILAANEFDFLILDYDIGGGKTGLDVLNYALHKTQFQGHAKVSSGSARSKIEEAIAKYPELSKYESVVGIEIYEKPASVLDLVRKIAEIWESNDFSPFSFSTNDTESAA